jgi:hypothetical protein
MKSPAWDWEVVVVVEEEKEEEEEVAAGQNWRNESI